MRGERGDGVDAGGSDRGVRVAEPPGYGGEHFGQVRRESVPVSLRENRQEVNALFPYGRLVGSVGGVNAGEKCLELVRFKSPSNGFKFRRRYRLSITVGELGKARENPVLEIVSHYLDFFGSGFANSNCEMKNYESGGGASGISGDIAGD